MRKEEDARWPKMTARRALAWVQGLEARAGRIHDVAMVPEAQEKHRDAVIWEKEAEVLRKQAETDKREVEVAKREITVERAEQEAIRMEEDVRRVRQREERLLKREKARRSAAEDWVGARDAVASAWGKLKGRTS